MVIFLISAVVTVFSLVSFYSIGLPIFSAIFFSLLIGIAFGLLVGIAAKKDVL